MATAPSNPFTRARVLATQGPARSRGPKTSVFAFATIARTLTVVVSSEVLDGAADDRTELLLGLLQQRSVRMYRYADDGPPVDSGEADHWGVPMAPGWITFVRADENLAAHAVGTAHMLEDGKQTSVTVGGRDLLNLATSHAESVYPDHDLEYLERRAAADVTAGLVAGAANADLFVTSRPLCVDQRGIRPGGVLAMLPDDALPVVSLYLRCGGTPSSSTG